MPNQCISYESLIGSMREMANNPNINLRTREILSNTVQYLNQNPKTAQLTKEALSNMSCTDVAEIGQKVAAGYKDITAGMATERTSGIVVQTAKGIDHIVGDISLFIDRNLGYNPTYGTAGSAEHIPPPLSGGYSYTTAPNSGLSGFINRGVRDIENGLAVVGALTVVVAAVYLSRNSENIYRRSREMFNRAFGPRQGPQ